LRMRQRRFFGFFRARILVSSSSKLLTRRSHEWNDGIDGRSAPREVIVRPDVACDRGVWQRLRLRTRLRPEPVIFLDCLTVAAREYAKRIKQEVDQGLDRVITPPRPDSILLQRMSPVVWHVLTQSGPPSQGMRSRKGPTTEHLCIATHVMCSVPPPAKTLTAPPIIAATLTVANSTSVMVTFPW
jgi:hypothetical protein